MSFALHYIAQKVDRSVMLLMRREINKRRIKKALKKISEYERI